LPKDSRKDSPKDLPRLQLTIKERKQILEKRKQLSSSVLTGKQGVMTIALWANHPFSLLLSPKLKTLPP
jgi:hypothetical protein